MFSHSPFSASPFFDDLSVSAVIIFYMLSGYTMGIKFLNFKETLAFPVRTFIWDRFLRIYPSYFCVLILTAIVVFFWGQSNRFYCKLNLENLIYNFFLLPTNYPKLLHVSLLIPPSYSLALEEQFYIMLPFLLMYKKIMNLVILGSLILIVGLLVSLLQGQDSHLYGDVFFYRNVITMLPVFFLGLSLGRSVSDFPLLQILYKFFIGLFLVASLFLFQSKGLVFPVAIGVIVGVPLVASLSKTPRNWIDDRMSLFAYPIFLTHVLAYLIVDKMHISDGIKYNAFALVVTGVLSTLLVFFVEIPVYAIRKKISVITNCPKHSPDNLT